MTPTIPEEAVQAASKRIDDYYDTPNCVGETAMRAALTAALPFLQGVKVKPLPTSEMLHTVLSYDPFTGLLVWKERKPGMIETKDERGSDWALSAWNKHHAGKEAFGATSREGYKFGKLFGVNYQAHRIVWKMAYGVDPDVIDHINGVKDDNRLENLRSCTLAENSRNYEKKKGTSQYRGVCWVERDKAWAARISNGRSGKVSLGNFKDEIAAARAYDAAARSLHGEFATLNFPNEVQL